MIRYELDFSLNHFKNLINIFACLMAGVFACNEIHNLNNISFVK